MLLAKPDGLTLLDHTIQVATAVKEFANAWQLMPSTAVEGAILHDLGKGHPAAQAMLLCAAQESLRNQILPRLPAVPAIRAEMQFRRERRNVGHRHEISSILFLPIFPEHNWSLLVDMVVAHHRSIFGGRSDGGLLDWIELEGPEATFERHVDGWAEWAPVAINTAERAAEQVGTTLVRTDIPIADARSAFDYTIEHCSKKKGKKGWSRWRGLLMAADHFASAYQDNVRERARGLFNRPDLRVFDDRARSTTDHRRYPLANVSLDDSRPHTLVIAPTGAGKTDLLMRRCCGRVLYTLPFQASINAMFRRFRNEIGKGADIRRLHGSSRVRTAGPDEDPELQRHPGAAIKVLTPFQLATIVFGTPGHEITALDVEGQDVVLDEVHTYSHVAQSMVLHIVRRLDQLGARVHIGSATIPRALRDQLVAVLGGEERVYEVGVSASTLRAYSRHTIHKEPTEDAAWQALYRAVEAGDRVLFISNQVARAQKRFRHFRGSRPDIATMLIHSRFRRCDRDALEERIRTFEFEDGPCVVFATQVIEVSLDISFDTMITDAAPLDALIQRFGRINRRMQYDRRPIHVIAPASEDRDLKPYAAKIVRDSYEVLPDGPLEEANAQTWLDQVYPTIEPTQIDAHVVIDEEGEFRRPELWNAQRAVLLDVLEIDGATAVVESDAHTYVTAKWDQRPDLEIPVPASLHSLKQLRQIERGSWPVVVPDAWYNRGGEPVGLEIDWAAERVPAGSRPSGEVI